MLQFSVNEQRCTQCQLCAKDCPALIIDASGIPLISAENEAKCYRCGHCLAICPTGAIAILGYNAEQSAPLAGNLPTAEQMETLIKGRRSVRHYLDANLPKQEIDDLLQVAWHAPTGHNTQEVHFTVIDDKDALARFRDKVYDGLEARIQREGLPVNRAFFADFVRLWREKNVDVLFRGAPHLVVASSPQMPTTPAYDCLIALSYFELYAQTKGIGTVWNGLLSWAINELVPGLTHELGIPQGHQFGYAMVFGPPAIHYARTINRGPAKVAFYR
jgi:nitroreductase/NAD-dependent dihydropyrimidine dehydrogenase PreA subunit